MTSLFAHCISQFYQIGRFLTLKGYQTLKASVFSTLTTSLRRMPCPALPCKENISKSVNWFKHLIHGSDSSVEFSRQYFQIFRVLIPSYQEGKNVNGVDYSLTLLLLLPWLAFTVLCHCFWNKVTTWPPRHGKQGTWHCLHHPKHHRTHCFLGSWHHPTKGRAWLSLEFF